MKPISKCYQRLLLTFLSFLLLNQSLLAQDVDIYKLDKPLQITIQSNQLTSDEAIKMAIMNNPTVKEEQANVLEGKYDIQEKRSYLYPHLYVSQTYSASNSPVNAFMLRLNQRDLIFPGININHPTTANNLSTRIGGTVTLYDRSLYDKLKISKLDFEIQKLKSKEEVNELVMKVRKAYLDVQYAKERLENSKKINNISKEQFKAVESKKEVGISTKGDFLAARAKLLSSDESVLKAQNDLNLAWIVLSDLVGDENIIGYDLVDPLDESMKIDDVDKLVKYSYENRPNILLAEKEKTRATKNLDFAKNSDGLKLSIMAEWGVDTIFADREISKSFTAGVFLNKSLFDGGLNQAQVRKAQAQIAKSEAKLNQVYKDVKIDVVQNYLNYKNAEERLKVANSYMEDANESLRSYTERYNVGLSTNLEVEVAESKLSDAMFLRTSALYDIKLAMIAIEKAVGTPLEDILNKEDPTISQSSEPGQNETKVDDVKQTTKSEEEIKVENNNSTNKELLSPTMESETKNFEDFKGNNIELTPQIDNVNTLKENKSDEDKLKINWSDYIPQQNNSNINEIAFDSYISYFVNLVIDDTPSINELKNVEKLN